MSIPRQGPADMWPDHWALVAWRRVLRWLRGWFWYLWSWPHGWLGSLGYAVRPYDPCLDARRWRWQRNGCWRASRRGREWQRALSDAIAASEMRGASFGFRDEPERHWRRVLRWLRRWAR